MLTLRILSIVCIQLPICKVHAFITTSARYVYDLAHSTQDFTFSCNDSPQERIMIAKIPTTLTFGNLNLILSNVNQQAILAKSHSPTLAAENWNKNLTHKTFFFPFLIWSEFNYWIRFLNSILQSIILRLSVNFENSWTKFSQTKKGLNDGVPTVGDTVGEPRPYMEWTYTLLHSIFTSAL